MEYIRERTARAFQAYGRTLEIVKYFKYLGQIMMALDDYWSAVVGNIRNTRKILERLSRILVKAGENKKGVGDIFLGGGAGGTNFCGGDVGDDLRYGTVPEGGFNTG